MDVSLVAPSVFPCVPKSDIYGSEWYWSVLADALSQEGINVTLVAPMGSRVSKATLIETIRPPSEWTGKEEIEAFNIYKDKIYTTDIIIDATHHWLPYKFKQKRILGICNGIQTDIPRARNKMCLITLSQWHRYDTLKRFNMNSEVIPYGLNPQDYNYLDKSEKDDYYLNLGIKLPHKGALDLVEIWPRDKKLIVAGEDKFGCPIDYVNKLKSTCESKGIEYLGSITYSDKIKLLSRARALILPFKRPEAFSLIALESMFLNTPVIKLSSDYGVYDGVPYNVSVNPIEKIPSVDPAFLDSPRDEAETKFDISKTVLLYKKSIRDITDSIFW